MAANNYPIVGPPALSPKPADGSVPLRLEIRDLQKNHADQWNLYLLGLQAFQAVDETKDLSWYGVAGIHGRPYRPWGGVDGNNPDGWQGYCTHTSILFAPWHRPYLALFEQLLYGTVQNIANSFPDSNKAKYQKAASTFRIPYWDWAASPPNGDQNFPLSVGSSGTVSVITPRSAGKVVQIPNPLYTHTFKPLNPVKGDFPVAPNNKWPRTLRYPTSSSSNAKSQEDQVFDAISNQFESYQANVNLILNDPNYKDFAAFSNHQWAPDAPGTYGSIENVHDSIHGEVGGNNGHMSDIDYAAFDPVFWLHHCNVDRLFAIWQALNPNSYAINKPAGDGTFTINTHSTETASTPLSPFMDATGRKAWNSQGVRRTETFNYAYPDTQRWKYKSDSDYQNSVQQAVQVLYGGISNQFMSDQGFNLMAAPPTKVAVIPAPDATEVKAGSSEHKATAAGSNMMDSAKSMIHNVLHPHEKQKPISEETSRGGEDFESEIGKPAPPTAHSGPITYTEYIVNILSPKHVLQQTYRVHIFLGDFPTADNSLSWHTTPTLVGTFCSFGKDAHTTACGKCVSDASQNVLVTGTVPLTSALYKLVKDGDSGLGSLEKANVLPYLTRNLHWRVTGSDGSDIRREDVAGLKVSVVTTEVSIQQGGFPRYSGVYEVHPEVTEGRPAGCGDGDRV